MVGPRLIATVADFIQTRLKIEQSWNIPPSLGGSFLHEFPFLEVRKEFEVEA